MRCNVAEQRGWAVLDRYNVWDRWIQAVIGERGRK